MELIAVKFGGASLSGGLERAQSILTTVLMTLPCLKDAEEGFDIVLTANQLWKENLCDTILCKLLNRVIVSIPSYAYKTYHDYLFPSERRLCW